jgi:hypothetical protein
LVPFHFSASKPEVFSWSPTATQYLGDTQDTSLSGAYLSGDAVTRAAAATLATAAGGLTTASPALTKASAARNTHRIRMPRIKLPFW